MKNGHATCSRRALWQSAWALRTRTIAKRSISITGPSMCRRACWSSSPKRPASRLSIRPTSRTKPCTPSSKPIKTARTTSVVPSTYFVDKMRKEGMLQKIDKSKLTNFSNLDPQMLNKPFDPNNDYSIPYIWGRRPSASTARRLTRKLSPAGPTCGSRNTKAACC